MNKMLEDFYAVPLKEKEYAILPLGQHSFIVRTANSCIWLDPFLTPLERRCVPVLCSAQEAVGADIITGSHDHADHIDRESLPEISAASPDAVFVFPQAVAPSVNEVPQERILPIDAGMSVTVKNVRITAVAAAHELIERDENGCVMALGYVIEADGVKFYHSGDCCIYEGLQSGLQKLGPFDFAFLPINGRDAVRYKAGCIGNMTYQEAVDLAGQLDIALTIPAHFDMFAFNSEDPQKFVDYIEAKYPSKQVHVPVPGKFFTGSAK